LPASLDKIRTGIAVTIVALFSAPAHAGGGVMLTSEARLHPLVQASASYDSNPHRSSGDAVVGDVVLRGQGGFEIAVPSDRMDVRMSNLLSYDHYLGLGGQIAGQSTAGLSTIKGRSSLSLVANKKGRVRIGVRGGVNRLDDPEPLNLGVRQGRWNTSGAAFLEWRPGGRALGLKPSASVASDIYDANGEEGALKDNRLTPSLRLDFDWRFLPRTQIIFNNAWTTAIYTNDEAQNGFADPVSSELGLMGQVTPRISAILAAGYSGSQFFLSSNGEPLHTFSGRAELRYDERRKSTWRLGFKRALEPVAMFGFLTDNSVYARYQERFRAGLKVNSVLKGSLRSFGSLNANEVIALASGDARADAVGSFGLSVLWQPNRSWLLGVTNNFEMFSTNSSFKAAGTTGDIFVDPSFTRNVSMLVFEAKY